MREKKNKVIRGVKGPSERSGKCPFIEDSFRECYCNDMRSLKTDEAIYYCGKHFEECPIYGEKAANHITAGKKLNTGSVR